MALTNVFVADGVIPYLNPNTAAAIHVNLPASVTYAAGTILGEVTGTPGTYKAYAATNVAAPTVALTLSDSATAGTFAAQDYWVTYTYTNGVGETTIAAPVKVTIGTASHSVGVASLTPLPTGATGVKYYASIAADGPWFLVASNHNDGTAAVLSAAPATTSAQAPETNTANAANDGSQTPVGILRYPCVTDAAGLITLGTGAVSFGAAIIPAVPSTPMWISGIFRTQDLTGLDAAAAAKLGVIIEGNTTTGLIKIAS